MALSLATIIAEGCGQAGSAETDVRSSHVALLTMMYMSCEVSAPRGRVLSEEQFRDYIQNIQQPTLDKAGVTIDEVFVSKRDGQPITVLYGKAAADPRNSGIVVFEQLGVDGIRLVGNRSGATLEMGEQEFNASFRSLKE